MTANHKSVPLGGKSRRATSAAVRAKNHAGRAPSAPFHSTSEERTVSATQGVYGASSDSTRSRSSRGGRSGFRGEQQHAASRPVRSHQHRDDAATATASSASTAVSSSADRKEVSTAINTVDVGLNTQVTVRKRIKRQGVVVAGSAATPSPAPAAAAAPAPRADTSVAASDADWTEDSFAYERGLSARSPRGRSRRATARGSAASAKVSSRASASASAATSPYGAADELGSTIRTSRRPRGRGRSANYDSVAQGAPAAAQEVSSAGMATDTVSATEFNPWGSSASSNSHKASSSSAAPVKERHLSKYAAKVRARRASAREEAAAIAASEAYSTSVKSAAKSAAAAASSDLPTPDDVYGKLSKSSSHAKTKARATSRCTTTSAEVEVNREIYKEIPPKKERPVRGKSRRSMSPSSTKSRYARTADAHDDAVAPYARTRSAKIAAKPEVEHSLEDDVALLQRFKDIMQNEQANAPRVQDSYNYDPFAESDPLGGGMIKARSSGPKAEIKVVVRRKRIVPQRVATTLSTSGVAAATAVASNSTVDKTDSGSVVTEIALQQGDQTVVAAQLKKPEPATAATATATATATILRTQVCSPRQLPL